MKRTEITYRSIANELDKLNAKLERAQKSYQKKLAIAEKLGVAEMTADEHREWLNTVPTENYMIVNKEDIKKNGAWFDLYSAKRDVEDIKGSIEKVEKRFEKAEAEVEAYYEELERIADLQEKENMMRLEFEQEQKEWAKDGIILESRYAGYTPSGKHFTILRNSGVTMRSFHCYTLYLQEQGVVFTSGEFWRAYGIIKKS